MKYFFILFTIITLQAGAQNKLVANKRYIESLNHWTALYTGRDSVYNYGYIYMDPVAGFSVHAEGTFKVMAKNVYVPTKRDEGTLNPLRLKDDQTKVAWIPESKFKELQISANPDWLMGKKMDTASASYLLKMAFAYNSGHETQKALSYLDRVKKLNPVYPGLDYEYAFSYNALHQFDKSEALLRKSLAMRPADERIYRELIYEEVYSDKMDKAEQTYNQALPYCTVEQKADLAYNICRIYYQKKNKPKFEQWATETKKWITAKSIQTDGLNKMLAAPIK